MTTNGRISPATRWHRMPDPEALVRAVTQRIIELAHTAIATHAEFRIVLAGGSTPQAVYRELVDASTDWSRWQVYDRTNHLKGGSRPAGTNVLFVDGHVQWRNFNEMQHRWFWQNNGNPCFWW